MHPIQSENLGLLMMLVAMVVGGVAIYRLVRWVGAAPTTPVPWSAELETSLQEPDAVPVCHHCFTPCPPRGWFCENCGGAVGAYNNLMPYVNVFSIGEVFRNGVTEKLRINALMVGGYMLLSYHYLVFAPIYWFFLFKNLKRVREQARATELRENMVE